MSLVIGHRSPGGGVILAADTRVWRYALECAGSLQDSCSKLMIVGANLAVGFAGELSSVIDPALRSIPKRADAEACIAHLARASVDRGFSCVAGVYGQPPWEGSAREAVLASVKLLKIESGEAREVQSGWAGSRDGFELFQGLMLGSRPASLERNEEALRKENNFEATGRRAESASEHLHAHATRVRAAMDEVIRSEQVPDVGDFLFDVVATQSGFRYCTDVDFFVEGPAHVAAHTNVLPRSVEDGGFTPIRLEGHVHGHIHGPRFPAIYFLQGGFGYLYFSADRSVPRANLVHAPTVQEFVKQCRAVYGVLLQGVGVGTEGIFAVDAHQDVMQEMREQLRRLEGQPAVVWSLGASRPTYVLVDGVTAEGAVRVRQFSLRSLLSSVLPFVSAPPTQYLRLDLVHSIEEASSFLSRAWRRR